jgi:Mn2+/Fe2+ NRAMP family transporter
MINNAAQTYLLLQSAQNNMQPFHATPLCDALFGIPLILILLVLTIGLVLDIVFKWEKAFDYMVKTVSILMLIFVIGFILSLFFVTIPLHI